MYVTNITTNDYNNSTNGYNKIIDNCTNSENNIDITIPTLVLTIPCGLSFLCFLSLMIITLNKPVINK